MVAGRANERFQTLSESCRRLLRLMRVVGFGRITFGIMGGEPDRSHPWRTLRTVKLSGGEVGPRPGAESVDFELRKEHVALFDQLALLRDGACVTIEVKYGLPFIIEIEQEQHAA